MNTPGAVIDAGDLVLPGRVDTLALAAPERYVFDRIAHDYPADEESDPFDLRAMGPELLAACAVSPTLTVEQARAALGPAIPGDVEEVLQQCLALCLPTAIDRAWWRLERDLTLRLEMDYCAPAGLPHSQFLGGMPLWTEQDRELAIAWTLRKRGTCQGCGRRRDEFMRDGHFDPLAFDVEFDDCPGCYQLSRARAKLKDGQAEHVHPYLVPAAPDDDGDGDD